MVKNPRDLTVLFGLFLLISCGQKKHTVEYGKTTRAQLVDLKGVPQREELLPLPRSVMLHYEEQKFQVKGDVILSSFRVPREEERTLFFWRHQFRDCPSVIKKISQEESELACEARGVSIIYTEGSPFISRIVEYEKR